MQYTTHYNLNLPEGTDVVNPLVQDNPNYTAIDTAMYENKQSVIGSATELTAGTVHTITRANTDSNYFRFTATSNWTAGDSMVVDTTPVSVYLSDGTTPDSGAYVINTEVLGILSGSRVTLITSAKTTTLPANVITYDNSSSSLTANDVQTAINELAANSDKRTVAISGDPGNTYADMVTAINTVMSALTANEQRNSYFVMNGLRYEYQSSGRYVCCNPSGTNSNVAITSAILGSGLRAAFIIKSDGTVQYSDMSATAYTGSATVYVRR